MVIEETEERKPKDGRDGRKRNPATSVSTGRGERGLNDGGGWQHGSEHWENPCLDSRLGLPDRTTVANHGSHRQRSWGSGAGSSPVANPRLH